MSEILLSEMERLHKLGFALLNIKEKDKRPVDSGWTSGERKTLGELKKQYRNGMNIGVRLGTPSKISNGKYLVALDLDLKSDEPRHKTEAYQTLEKITGQKIGDLVRVLSGRGNGSMHVYGYVTKDVTKFNVTRSAEKIKAFMGNDNPPSKADKAALTAEELDQGYRLRPAWEIDLMGRGAQVLLPPSIHPLTNKEYTWGKIYHSCDDLKSFDHIVKSEKTESVAEVIVGEFKPEIVDLVFSDLPDKYCKLIMTGEGLDEYENDRTRALMACIIVMVKCGFTQNQIASVFTDKENFLGQVAYDHKRDQTNRDKAAHWIIKYNYQKAVKLVNEQRSFDDNVEFIEDDLTDAEKKERHALLKSYVEENIKPIGDWRGLLHVSDNGNIKKSNFNLQLIIKNTLSECGGSIYFDTFYSTEFLAGFMPWEKEIEIKSPRRIQDIDLVKAVMWFSSGFKIETNEESVLRAIQQIGQKDKRHCIQDYVKSCVWDKTPRLDTWLKKYMGAKNDDNYLAIIGRKLILAMVYRAFQPGCQFDQVVIFQGDQGVGKSTALRALGGEWFTDNLGAVGDKDALLIIHRHWLIEVAELDSMTKADADHFKQFVSSRIDEFRKPYGRVSEAYPRQCVLVGTTNRDEFLKDDTGNRRFWPVEIGTVDLAGLTGVRDQLFGEAYAAYLNGEALWSGINDEFKNSLKDMHAQFDIIDESESIFAKVLINFKVDEAFTIPDLLKLVEPLNGGHVTRYNEAMSKKIGKILRSYKCYRKAVRVKGTGKFLKRWFITSETLVILAKAGYVTGHESHGSTNTGLQDAGF